MGKRGFTAQECSNDVADCVKEEEFGDDEGLDEHGEGGDDDGEEGDDVHGADDVEDDKAWTRQGFLEEGHSVFEVAERGLV